MNRYDMEFSRSNESIIVAQNTLVRQVYAWMGMGLTLARRIAMSFGGDVRAGNREGGGATFVMLLPLREA